MKSTLAQELDFENEGRNGERCHRELKPLDYIHVPAVHWDKTSKVSLVSAGLVYNCR
jgi:aarF domain-containing kinase